MANAFIESDCSIEAVCAIGRLIVPCSVLALPDIPWSPEQREPDLPPLVPVLPTVQYTGDCWVDVDNCVSPGKGKITHQPPCEVECEISVLVPNTDDPSSPLTAKLKIDKNGHMLCPSPGNNGNTSSSLNSYSRSLTPSHSSRSSYSSSGSSSSYNPVSSNCVDKCYYVYTATWDCAAGAWDSDVSTDAHCGDPGDTTLNSWQNQGKNLLGTKCLWTYTQTTNQCCFTPGLCTDSTVPALPDDGSDCCSSSSAGCTTGKKCIYTHNAYWNCITNAWEDDDEESGPGDCVVLPSGPLNTWTMLGVTGTIAGTPHCHWQYIETSDQCCYTPGLCDSGGTRPPLPDNGGSCCNSSSHKPSSQSLKHCNYTHNVYWNCETNSWDNDLTTADPICGDPPTGPLNTWTMVGTTGTIAGTPHCQWQYVETTTQNCFSPGDCDNPSTPPLPDHGGTCCSSSSHHSSSHHSSHGPPNSSHGPPNSSHGPPNSSHGPPNSSHGPPNSSYHPPTSSAGGGSHGCNCPKRTVTVVTGVSCSDGMLSVTTEDIEVFA